MNIQSPTQSNRPIRVCIVDDSAMMRALLRHVLGREPDIEIVGEAADPYEAREVIKAVAPDVLTLDVEMPRMNGLDFLERLMRLRPTPVVMVSSLTAEGAEVTISALSLGAVDYVLKPSLEDQAPFPDLAGKIRVAARVRRIARPIRQSPPTSRARFGGNRLVAIGASTGGVDDLIDILSRFPAECPPTLIVQHMPGRFTRSFADRLDRSVLPEVREAEDGMELRPGRVIIAPGGIAHLTVDRMAKRCVLLKTDPVGGHRPSVDTLFHSFVPVADRVMGVILTGMGRDGSSGLQALRQCDSETLAQERESCVVYGMPRAAVECGAAGDVVPLSGIADRILAFAGGTVTEQHGA